MTTNRTNNKHFYQSKQSEQLASQIFSGPSERSVQENDKRVQIDAPDNEGGQWQNFNVMLDVQGRRFTVKKPKL